MTLRINWWCSPGGCRQFAYSSVEVGGLAVLGHRLTVRGPGFDSWGRRWYIYQLSRFLFSGSGYSAGFVTYVWINNRVFLGLLFGSANRLISNDHIFMYSIPIIYSHLKGIAFNHKSILCLFFLYFFLFFYKIFFFFFYYYLITI